MARPTGRPIREELIDAACAMVQAVGVNSFSYGDLAKQLDISSPSIHHHFPAKSDLVGAVAARYRQDFASRRDAIEGSTPAERIRAYAALFAETSAREMMCVCGSVAADWLTVGDAAREEVAGFFDDQVQWLEHELAAGVAAKEFLFDGTARDHAVAVLAALEGSLLMARARGGAHLPVAVGDTLIALMAV